MTPRGHRGNQVGGAPNHITAQGGAGKTEPGQEVTLGCTCAPGQWGSRTPCSKLLPGLQATGKGMQRGWGLARGQLRLATPSTSRGRGCSADCLCQLARSPALEAPGPRGCLTAMQGPIGPRTHASCHHPGMRQPTGLSSRQESTARGRSCKYWPSCLAPPVLKPSTDGQTDGRTDGQTV